MFKVTWMAEDGEVSYTEVKRRPPEVGDVEEFDVTVKSFRQVVKVVDEQGTVPGAPAPTPTPDPAPVIEPEPQPVDENGDPIPTPPEEIPVAGPENPAGA